MLHISIKPEAVAYIGNFPVTNSLITNILVLTLFFIVSLIFSLQLKRSSNTFTFAIKHIVVSLHDFFKDILSKETMSAMPIILSIFMFVLLNNWAGLIPGVGSITVPAAEKEHVVESSHEDEKAIDTPATDSHENSEKVVNDHSEGEATRTDSEEEEHHASVIPLFRGTTADLNTTIMLAVLSFLVIQFYGVKVLGFGYLKKFINLHGPIDFFVGLLEVISEFSKIISFAFRLFGNIFAGEVLLVVIAFLIPVVASFPFLLLEVFVGFIQALVFAMLTAIFINVATTAHH